jgi:ParB family chromosome partitioning protein
MTMTDGRRGLGRGLSALLGDPVPTDLARPSGGAWIPPSAPVAPTATPAPNFGAPASAAANNVVELAKPAASPSDTAARHLPINQITPNPNQPRRQFEEADLEELAASIRSRGVLQPILVRPVTGQSDRYEIVAGERRWRAAQRAELLTIPAVVRPLDESEVLEIGIIENVQRVDLNPLEEAMGYQALIDRFGRTQQEIAEIVGKSRPHIANTLRLLSLPDEIRTMVTDGRLTAGHARAVLTAPDPVGLARQAVTQGLNVRDLERLAAKAKDERDGPRVTGGAPPSEKDGDTLTMERSLAEALGLDVAILRKGEGAGELRISFKRLDQLDDLCRRLSAAQF